MMVLCFLWKFGLSICILSTAFHQSSGDIHRIRKPTSSLHLKPSRKFDTISEDAVDTDRHSNFNAIGEDGERKDYVCALLATFLVGLTGILPLALPLDAKHVSGHADGNRRLNLFLSFAVGGLLGDVFLHLLPEAFSHFKPGDRSGRVQHGVLLLAGLLLFLILEAVFNDDANDDDGSHKEHNDESVKENGTSSQRRNGHPRARQKASTKNGYTTTRRDKNDNKYEINSNKMKEEKKQITGYLNLLANFIDNFTHGLAVGGSFMVSSKVGWHTTLAILLHEVPHEIGDFAILLKAGFRRWEAAKSQFFTSIGGLVGCLVALLADSADTAGSNTAWILPFTSGGFLNIALVSIVPDLMKETHVRESVKQVLCVILGVTVMALVNLFPE